jgi:hypothetical protein
MVRFGPASPLRTAAALLCALAARAQDELQERINHALTEARPALLDHLSQATQRMVRPGELALLTLAAIHDGVDGSEKAFAKACERLAGADPEETYDLALRLLVLEAWPPFPDRLALAQKDTKKLLTHRDSSGAFGYRKKPGSWDLSNTQYAALGLRAGRGIGVEVERSVWVKLGKEVGSKQDAYGGFGYTRGMDHVGAYPSMTVAGIAVLAICRQHLDGAQTDLDKRIARGWQWFDRNAQAVGSANEHWCFYFHYGLERAAILTDVTAVGGDDWYRKGASMFVDRQLPGGGWKSQSDHHSGTELDRGRGDSVSTAFAVLFLRRKFQKQAGPITPHVVRLVNLGAASAPRDVEECARQLGARGLEAMPEVLQALRSDVETRRRAAAAAMLVIAGETFGYDAARDAAGNSDAVRKAELWYLRKR